MRQTRLARYKEKSDYIVTTIESIPNTLESDIERSAAYYKLHTSTEAAMDIVAMLLKDLGKDVGDDYTNIQSLGGGEDDHIQACGETPKMQWSEELSRAPLQWVG